MTTELSFGEWLKRRRRGLGLTQEDLAARIAYSVETIRKLESDTVRPSKALAEKLTEPLGIPPGERTTFVQYARTGYAALPPPPLPLPTPSVAPPSTLSPPPRLPTPPTPFIGRSQEVADITQLIREANTRLVNLTGPGGTGKTRLALEVAARLGDAFADGVYFVPLASLSDPSLLAPTLARTLGLQENERQTPLTVLLAALSARQTLLVLDNLEQIAAAAPLITEVLIAAPGVKVLVTSRWALRLQGENVYPVPPLALPDATADTAQLAQSDAVQLFVQRARYVKPDFALTSVQVTAIAAICARLDGLPLALELAAARVNVLTPTAMLPRLDRRLRFLTGGARDLPPHQQTLRATLDWSYEGLTPAEQDLFAHLSVFAGSFTLAAAEAVWTDQRAVELDTLDTIQGLTDKSLLRVQTDGSEETRFAMLETVREYGLERLAASDVAETARRRHAEHFLALAELAEPELRGPEQAQWLQRLGIEYDNIQAALDWVREHEEHEMWLRFGAALWRFWWTTGLFTVGWGWTRHALDEPLVATNAEEQRLRARALNGAGNLAWALGEFDTARRCHELALGIWRELGDQRGMAIALGNLGILAKDQSDYRAARHYHEDSLVLSRRLGDRLSMAYSLNNLGVVTMLQGDAAAAQALFEESLVIRRDLNDERGIATVIGNLGYVAYQRGDLRAAQSLLEDSLARQRRLGSRFGIANTLGDLGNVAHDDGDLSRARSLYEDSLAVRRDLADRGRIAKSLNDLGLLALDEGELGTAGQYLRESADLRRGLTQQSEIAETCLALAELSLAEGHAERAAHLLGAAAALSALIGVAIHRSARLRMDRSVEAIRARLGDDGFERAYADGHALLPDAAFALVFD